MTPAESRTLLVDLRQRALAAGLSAALAEVDATLARASQRAIGILREALEIPRVEAAVAAPAPVMQAPRTAPVMVRCPLSLPSAGQPAAVKPTSVLAGLKKPEAERPVPTFRQPLSVPKQPRKPTGWDPSDDEIPL